jgi:hypothetical protein
MNSKLSYMPLLMVLSFSVLPPALAAESQWRNHLPPTIMDSFVLQAKSDAEIIYGDEGTTSIPPYFGFEKCSRINAGIMDERDQGLTTGHGSYMPDAAGRDEFLGQEWTQSGARGRAEALGFQDGKPVVVAPRNASCPVSDEEYDLSFVGENDPAWEKK